ADRTVTRDNGSGEYLKDLIRPLAPYARRALWITVWVWALAISSLPGITRGDIRSRCRIPTVPNTTTMLLTDVMERVRQAKRSWRFVNTRLENTAPIPSC